MYKNFSRFCVYLVSSLLFSQVVLADNVPGNRVILRVQSYNNWAAVQFSPSYVNNLGCASPSSAKSEFVVIDWSSDSTKKAMYATALAAFSTGSKVGFGIASCSGKFAQGVPQAYRVDMVQQ